MNKTLLVGDAFTLTTPESLGSVVEEGRISGPPKHPTTDWEATENSVKLLRDLHPSLGIPSHGEPMGGAEFSQNLDVLIENFRSIAKHDRVQFFSGH